MRKIKEIIRLDASQLSQHQISRSLNISSGAVNKYLKLAKHVGLSWPLADDIDDRFLWETLSGKKKQCVTFVAPDYIWIYQELRHKGVTLQLLHEEYCLQYPDTYYSYRQFCSLYSEWKKTKKLSLRQEHKGGDKTFIDYAGQTIPIIIDRRKGTIQQAQIFVAILGASNYTYSEASFDQSSESWIGSHVRAFTYFGGVTSLIVPDNLKSGVSHACRYDPDLNPSYTSMINHYDTAVLPARPYRPKDKSKVENAVLVVERWILARLRHKVFYSLSELNDHIKILLEDLNNRPFKKMEGTRKTLFEEVDKPALKPLPKRAFEYAKYYHRKLGLDYHVEFKEHFYSVPHSYVGRKVEIRITEHVIEVLCEGKRIASHPRKKLKGKTTLPDHMPKSHRKHVEWTKERSLEWSQEVGTSTSVLVKDLIKKKKHPDQALRSCLGLYRLGKHFGQDRLEAACRRALYYEVSSYKNVAQILENNLDRETLEEKTDQVIDPIIHTNLRGSTYYN